MKAVDWLCKKIKINQDSVPCNSFDPSPRVILLVVEENKERVRQMGSKKNYATHTYIKNSSIETLET